MKRTPLQRRTPLTRVTPLRTSTLKPHRPRYTGPTPTVRGIVRARSGGWCERVDCLRIQEHLHHRSARRAGGSSDPAVNRPSNLVALCAVDHMWVESHRVEAYGLGLLVRAGLMPAEVPVVTRHGRVLLDDEGGWRVA